MIQDLERLCADIMRPDNEYMQRWQWGQGVVLFALERAYYKTGNLEYIHFIENWLSQHLEKEIPGFSVNTTAPLNGALGLYEITGEKKYLGLCKKFARWLMAENPRCEKGVFEHTCTGNSCPNQMWVDTVFMSGIFLVRYGRITGNRMYVNEALRQLVLHYDFLRAEDTDLLYHGYFSDDRQRHGIQWGRGNAWFSAACGVILELVDHSYPLKKELEERFKRHTLALLKFQRKEGGWGTILNDETSYLETSGTCGAAYGIAKALEMGYIDKKYAPCRDRAYDFLHGKIEKNGVMTCGSNGTCVMEEPEEYIQIIQKYSEFTQGLAILAFSI